MIIIELRNKDFTVLERLEREAHNLSWAYSRIGGCGEFNFSLPRKLFEEKSISGDFNIRIYWKNTDTGAFDLWYQGLVEDKLPAVRGNSQDIDVSGHGYSTQLSRVYLDEVTYVSQEISAIVKDIMDTYVVPNTDITYDVADIEATGFTPASLSFNDNASSAIKKCADIAGGIEWGVDKDRKFFFKARSTTVGLRLPFGKNIMNYTEDIDYKKIVNRIVVQGAQVGGTYYKNTYNELVSQLKYNLRTQVKSNSSIVTDDVASKYATSIFEEFAIPQRRASCDLVDFKGLIEATTPLPLVNILKESITYGTKKYGEFLYSGQVDRQINRINYKVTNTGSLLKSLDFAESRPAISEQFSRINYNIEQQRSAAL